MKKDVKKQDDTAPVLIQARVTRKRLRPENPLAKYLLASPGADFKKKKQRHDVKNVKLQTFTSELDGKKAQRPEFFKSSVSA